MVRARQGEGGSWRARNAEPSRSSRPEPQSRILPVAIREIHLNQGVESWSRVAGEGEV